ncbi:MAG: DUF5666 domain-containing protein [Rubrivivax sp.]|jgi:hypothetical protein|nr:DUF5666 domain-containing protein [Rubrivivax sp.]
MNATPKPQPVRRAALALLWPLMLLLHACGGGVGTGGTGSETGNAFSAGPIAGFGSVIVNDVRFDDGAATVEDADGTRSSRDALRLGMTVEVDSGPIASSAAGGSTATARSIRFASLLVGPALGIDLGGDRFEVLGQRVTVDDQTVFDPAFGGAAGSGLERVRAGQIVEVYGTYDSAQRRIRATRIEPRALAAAFVVRGPVSGLDRVAQTLRIADTVFVYAGASAVPADLAVEQFVRLRVATVPLAGGRWQVQGFGTAQPSLPETTELRVRGLITAFTSPASFSVDGRRVDAAAATFPDGSNGLAVGVRVELEGRASAGVLRASRVSIRSDGQIRDRGFELRGAVATVDAANRRFELRGLVVSTARPDLRVDGGSLADLAPGRRVVVQAQLAADRIRLEATRIQFE